MKIQSLKLVYFSPTGTTKTVIEGIARGINQSPVETYRYYETRGKKTTIANIGK